MLDTPANLRDEFLEMIDLVGEDYFERVFSKLNPEERRACLRDLHQTLDPSGRDVQNLTDAEYDSLLNLLISLFPNLAMRLAKLSE